MRRFKKHQEFVSAQRGVIRFAIDGLLAVSAVCLICIVSLAAYLGISDYRYRDRIYPHVSIGGIDVSGLTKPEVQRYWLSRNIPFRSAVFTFRAESVIATVSGQELDLGYDATLSAEQAYLVGRSGNFPTDLSFRLFHSPVELAPYFRWKNDILDDLFSNFTASLDIPAQNALFTFKDGKVESFKPSAPGRRANTDKAIVLFTEKLKTLTASPSLDITIEVPLEPVEPEISTASVNGYGIREKIGHGYSEFSGSIAGRIHNVALAASRFNGVLMPPGETTSFNKTLGDVSAATGYQPAYIIKAGRTVLGDGGGVCQVSTTLFRAAMDAGLPIIERHAHAYRVHYYEEGGYKPGLDATVYDPEDDLKIKNDTGHYILIQTATDTDNLTLEFDLYGAGDGRKSEIYNQKVWDISPPPDPLYQDDPTLQKDVVKQVDWSAWGAKASFDYKVTRDNQILTQQTFFSNYRPWQAVYLKGTKE